MEITELKLNPVHLMKKNIAPAVAPVTPIAPAVTIAAKSPVTAAPVKTPPAPAVTVATKMPVTVAPAKTSPAPAAPVTAAPAKKQIAAAVAAITIEAKIDVGFGNKLFVRGQGAGLSWDHGIPLECVDSKTWRLTVPATDNLQFKLLINDSEWAKGEDVVAAPGKRVQVIPAF